MQKILVLCTGNSCRSQIAHGYLQLYAGNSNLIYSAGIETHGVNPLAVAVMKEDGIDISHYTSNNVDEYKHISFDFVITVCDHANEKCPIFIGNAIKFHCNFLDPAKTIGSHTQIVEEFKKVRDMIKEYCHKFVVENIKLETNIE